jgi:small nuclear ribonucleoprotein (snRNP)-like protein
MVTRCSGSTEPVCGLQVELKDGRQIEGDFQCLDKQGNLVLSNSCELIDNPLSKQPERQMGMVLIPKAYQVKVQVKVSGMHVSCATFFICDII